MTDPVQVVAEAQKAHRWVSEYPPGSHHCSCGRRGSPAWFSTHLSEAIVAALQAAGAFMPDEAERERDEMDMTRRCQ